MGIMQDYKKYLVNDTKLMENSVVLYVRTVHLFYIEYGNNFTVGNINKFITEHTDEKYSYYMRAPFKYYFDMIGKKGMFNKVKNPKRLPRKKTYKDIPIEVIKRVLNKIDNPMHRLIAKIQFETGARASDILKTKRGHVVGNEKDGYRIRIIGKGAIERWASLSKNIAEAILYIEKKTDNKFIFIRSHSKDDNRAIRTSYHYYWKSLKRAVEKSGVDFSTHYFRHKYITDALNEGFDIFSIQKDIGHKRIDTTIRYMMENKANKEISKRIRGIE